MQSDIKSGLIAVVEVYDTQKTVHQLSLLLCEHLTRCACEMQLIQSDIALHFFQCFTVFTESFSSGGYDKKVQRQSV